MGDVPIEIYDVVLLPDELEGLVSQTEFKAACVAEEHELSVMELEQGLWVDTCEYGLPVVEDQLKAQFVDEHELIVED